MDDDEAFMQLVLSNSQGELTPLEIGMHALKAVPPAAGGRGQRGGLSEYAGRLGRSLTTVSELRSAAGVLETLRSSEGFTPELGERAKHLYEVSKAPRETWSILAEAMLKRGWPAVEVKSAVDKVRQFTIPDAHAAWLPLTEIAARFVSSGKPGPAAIDQLVSTVDGVLDAIDRDGSPDEAIAFCTWLVDHRGKESWDRRQISDYHVALIRAWAERAAAEAAAAAEDEPAPTLPEGVDLRVGEFQTALKDLPDGYVDALITDPPYPAEFLPLFTDLGGRRDLPVCVTSRWRGSCSSVGQSSRCSSDPSGPCAHRRLSDDVDNVNVIRPDGTSRERTFAARSGASRWRALARCTPSPDAPTAEAARSRDFRAGSDCAGSRTVRVDGA